MLQSFALLAGPFLASSDFPQALWSIGNEHTCRLDGFLYLLGMTAVPMYTVFLCVYYLCKLKNRMTDAQFCQRIEKKVHAFIVVINLGVYLLAWILDVINPSFLGNYCGPASMPTGCVRDPATYGECERGGPAVMYFLVFSFALVPVSSLCAIIVCIGLIFWHTLMRERVFGFGLRYNTHASTSSTNDDCHANTSSTNDDCIHENDTIEEIVSGVGVQVAENANSRDNSGVRMQQRNRYLRSTTSTPTRTSGGAAQPVALSSAGQNMSNAAGANINICPSSDGDTQNNYLRPSDSTDVKTLSRLYKKELVAQVCCYIMFFCLVHLPFFILLIKGSNPNQISHTSLRAIAILYPLAGLFNIIVYTRWNVRSWKRSHPECSWLLAFWLVLKAGGDLPGNNEDEDEDEGVGVGEGLSSNKVDSIELSSEPFGVTEVKQADVEVCSVVAMDRDTSSLEDGDLRFKPKSEWVYLKGGVRSDDDNVATSSPRFEISSSTATIRHANC